MSRMTTIALTSLGLAGLLATSGPAQSVLVFDRALPKGNLNNAAAANRSNVRWSWYDHGFVGDDFSIGAPGERWVADKIRIWTVAGGKMQGEPSALGDFYQDVRLYFGDTAGDLSPIASGRLTPGSNASSNSNITITRVSDAPAFAFDDFGTFAAVWQVDFENLNLTVAGGSLYRFGAWGLGRPLPGSEDKTYPWFTHASNAALSETPQDGADNVLLAFNGTGKFEGTFDSKEGLWNKSSDLNVQVFAHLFAGIAVKGSTVTLFGSPSVNAAQLDAATLRFGPQQAAPLRSTLEDVDGDGRLDLVLEFSPGAATSGCLTGKRADGTPFAGCTAE